MVSFRQVTKHMFLWWLSSHSSSQYLFSIKIGRIHCQEQECVTVNEVGQGLNREFDHSSSNVVAFNIGHWQESKSMSKSMKSAKKKETEHLLATNVPTPSPSTFMSSKTSKSSFKAVFFGNTPRQGMPAIICSRRDVCSLYNFLSRSSMKVWRLGPLWLFVGAFACTRCLLIFLRSALWSEGKLKLILTLETAIHMHA